MSHVNTVLKQKYHARALPCFPVRRSLERAKSIFEKSLMQTIQTLYTPCCFRLSSPHLDVLCTHITPWNIGKASINSSRDFRRNS